MELRQIHYFIAIAEAEHFGRASARLRIAQPALSRQIRQLEDDLGVALFERLPRGVRLTPAGRSFLDEARVVVAQVARAAAAARAVAAGRAGVLRLTFIEAVAWHGLVPDALRRFREAFPGVELSLAAMPTAEQLAALRQGRTDAALIYNLAPADDLAAQPLVRHPVLLAVPAASPFAARAEVETAELAGLPMVGFQRRASPRLFDDVHARLRAAGVAPRYIAETTSETEMLALVSAGAGVGLANACQRWRPPQGVRFVPIRDFGVTLTLNLVQRRGDATPTVAQFARILAELAA